ncbi:MAG: glycosyltransferase family A protein [Limnohabitans sp.]|nr:glycosyltransferase family A protein [Limnohabitans sp.]
MDVRELFVVFYSNDKIVEVLNWNSKEKISVSEKNLSSCLFKLSALFPKAYIGWCHIDVKENANFDNVEAFFKAKNTLLSYNPYTSFLSSKIGYVDESIFVNCNKKVKYPTWQAESLIGVTTSEVLCSINKRIKPEINFRYFLVSFSKLAITEGLFCYSEPNLLKNVKLIQNKENKHSNYTLFRFVSQHYKKRWLFLLMLNFFFYERRVLFLPLLYSLFFRTRLGKVFDFKNEESTSAGEIKNKLDVIIPTIGREKFLLDFLMDLEGQTHKPTKVIIVEQNLEENSVSSLDFLVDRKWGFQIKHIFTHQAGACNARNLALKEVENDWVFFADDDIRIDSNFIEEAFVQLAKNQVEAITFGCYQKNQARIYSKTFQWTGFGSGCSFVKSERVKKINFNLAYEFGFGEDGDFGMQLRNDGVDVLYCPTPEILHLKAPVGGFRTKPAVLWKEELIQPKPSPTVMVYNLLHLSKEQQLGYKTILFFKFYRNQKIKNPIKYYFSLSKQWDKSIFWAKTLLSKV